MPPVAASARIIKMRIDRVEKHHVVGVLGLSLGALYLIFKVPVSIAVDVGV